MSVRSPRDADANAAKPQGWGNHPSVAGPPRWRRDAGMVRLPASLKVTVPLILLVFAATLCAVNLVYHVPQAEQAAEEDSRKRLAQEMSRLQSTLEYLLLKGDLEAAQHEIAVLAHNHDVVLAALTDDRNEVIAATRRAWLGRQIDDVSPQFDLDQAARAIRERRAGIGIDSNGNELLGHAGILIGSERDELRPSRAGSLFLAYDLKRYKSEARAQVVQQSLYWTGWVTALALAMWLVFHFLLTRRTARLVDAAEQIAAGNLDARSDLGGHDELGRLGRAFDAMARDQYDREGYLVVQRALSPELVAAARSELQAMTLADKSAQWLRDIEVPVVRTRLKTWSAATASR